MLKSQGSANPVNSWCVHLSVYCTWCMRLPAGAVLVQQGLPPVAVQLPQEALHLSGGLHGGNRSASVYRHLLLPSFTKYRCGMYVSFTLTGTLACLSWIMCATDVMALISTTSVASSSLSLRCFR